MTFNTLQSAVEKEWDKRGYYQVGNQKFYSKVQAIVAGKTSGHYPEFRFNDESFSAANWIAEPSETLQELYKKRAWQLRNKYDHLVLSFSGGADSTNILQTFVKNNIPLDEVFCFGPFSTRQGHDKPLTRDAENNFREIDLVALPYLKELSKTHKFKITLYDWTEDLVKHFKNTDWIWTETQSRLSPSIVVRNRLHNARSHLNLVDAGKKVGFIFGIDKPKVILKNGSYYMTFLDLNLNMGVGPGALVSGAEWEFDEYFYWTPDLPELVIKQGHVLKNFFEANNNLKCYVQDADQGGWAKYASRYGRLVKQLMYPEFDLDTWQTEKISSLTYTNHDNWFINSNLKERDIWLAGLNELQTQLGPEWFNQGSVDHGFIGSWSKWYKIGDSINS